MSKGDTFENDLLRLIFNATAIANLADNAASSPITNLHVSLHTADPGEGGSQTTNEVTTGGFGQYARVAVARTTAGWTVTGNSVSPVANIAWSTMTTGSGATATHFGVGTAASGAGKLLYKGTITPSIAISNGVTPTLTTASTITED
jgi:hypothetical protein